MVNIDPVGDPTALVYALVKLTEGVLTSGLDPTRTEGDPMHVALSPLTKLSATAIFAILIPLTSVAAGKASSDETGLKRLCSLQIMTTVKTAQIMGRVNEITKNAKDGKVAVPSPTHKIVFSKPVDDQYMDLLKEQEELVNQSKKGSLPEKALAEKIQASLDKAIVVSEKSASKELSTCMDWMKALESEATKICPPTDKATLEAKSAECIEKANAKPSVKEKSERWKTTLRSLRAGK